MKSGKKAVENQIRDFRKLFPAYSECVYLNHAAISPLSQLARRALMEYWEERAHFPVDIYPDLQKRREDFTAGIAALIGAGSGQNISLVPNTSIGLNIVAQGLEINPGDEIVLPAVEFPANVYPFMNLEKKGARVVWVPARRGRIPVEDIQAKTTVRTRLISISFVQYLNGYRADLKTLGRWCRGRGIILCVDGIQGAGAIPVHVGDCRIDAFASGGHKWLMWPMGTGFLYTSPRLRKEMNTGTVGWLSVKNPWDLLHFSLDLKESGERYEPGTLNFPGLSVARRVLQRFLDIGIHRIHQRITWLTGLLAAGLKELELPVESPLGPGETSGIVSIRCSDPPGWENRLREMGVICASREGLLRFSPHFTNTEGDILHTLECLKKISSRS